MIWDWNLVVAFAIGVLAGFQAIYERYGDESFTSVNTFPGYSYLALRGLVPAFFFLLLYASTQNHTFFHLLGLAVGLGLGTEVVLRSQIQLKSTKRKSGALTNENTFIGLFNLLDWVQKLVLESINTRMAAKRQSIVRRAVGQVPTDMRFDRVCELVRTNADALGEDREITNVRDESDRQLAEYRGEIKSQGGTSAPEIEDRYRYKLGYWIYRNANRSHGLRVLFNFEDRPPTEVAVVREPRQRN
jgi:hypothetical protein